MNRFALLVMTALALTGCQTGPAPALGATATALDNNPMKVSLPAGIDAPIGVGFDGPNPDLGRYEFTRNDGDRGRFKTPTLREITFTAPYMHDGSEPTLADVIEYYDRGGNPNPYLDSDIEPLHLSRQEKADLLAFLLSFSGEGWKVQAPIQLPADNDSIR